MGFARGCKHALGARSSSGAAPRGASASLLDAPPVKRRARLSRSRDFDAVYRQGRSVSTRYLVLYSFPRGDGSLGESRLGLAVSRKIGGAVVRNRLKRRLRAAFEELGESVPSERDYVLIARPGLAEAAETHGAGWLRAQVAEVVRLSSASDVTTKDAAAS